MPGYLPFGRPAAALPRSDTEKASPRASCGKRHAQIDQASRQPKLEGLVGHARSYSRTIVSSGLNRRRSGECISAAASLGFLGTLMRTATGCGFSMRRRVLLVVHCQTCLADYAFIGDRCHRPNSGSDDPHTTGRARTRPFRPPLATVQSSLHAESPFALALFYSSKPPGSLTCTFGTKDGGKGLARFIDGGNWRTMAEVIS